MQNVSWRYAKAADLPMIHQWCDDHKFPRIPDWALPDSGIIVTNEGQDIYCGFIVKTNCGMALLEWVISNKSAPIKLKRNKQFNGLDYLVNVASILAKSWGYRALFHTTNNQGLIKNLRRNQFDEADHNVTNLLKIL